MDVEGFLLITARRTCAALPRCRSTSGPLLAAKLVCVADPERRPATPPRRRWSDGGVGPPCSCPLLPLSHLIPSSCPIHPAAAVLRPSLPLSHPVIKKSFSPLVVGPFVPETQRWMGKLLEWAAQKVVPQGEQPQLHTGPGAAFSGSREAPGPGLSVHVCVLRGV